MNNYANENKTLEQEVKTAPASPAVTPSEEGKKGQLVVGDIFYESWGYEQTNIDFCKVVEISPTGKTVKCQMMSEKIVKTEEYSPMAEEVVPNEVCPKEGTFRLHVRTYRDGEVSLVGQYPYCHGDTRMGYFTRWEGKPLYQSHYA